MCGWEDYADHLQPRSAAPSRAARRRLGWAMAACAAVLYGGSLVLPTAAPFNPGFSTTTFRGYDAFRAWKALLAWQPGDIDWWVLGVAWLANPAIWVAVALTAAGRRRSTGVAAACGMALGLVALPRYYGIVADSPGYWVWLGSAGVMLATSLGQWYWEAAEFALRRLGESPVLREGTDEAPLAAIASAPRVAAADGGA